jgi:beta-mannanase
MSSTALRRNAGARSRRKALRRSIAPTMMLGLLVALLAQQHHLIVRHRTTTYAPYRAPANQFAGFQLGVTTGPLARDAWRPWTAADLQSVDALEQAAQAHAGIVMWYADWRRDSPSIEQLNDVLRRGSIPEITWEPWDARIPPFKSQPAYRLINIVRGNFDPLIWKWARALAAWHKTVYLRFAQEFNGYWYPWADWANGNHPGQFAQAWRHVHQIFAAAGATNVKWVWSPFSGAPAQDFPGAGEVDILGLTCLNGVAVDKQPWRSFASLCGQSISQLHALASTLPIQISEAGSTEQGGNKAFWIAGMFAYLKRHPVVTSLIMFNMDKETNWPVQSSATSERAFQTGLQSLRAWRLPRADRRVTNR